MKQKINIAELLKDCPKGMELDCLIYENVVFEKLDVSSSHHPIIIRRRTDSINKYSTTVHLTKYGQYSDEEDCKCLIYPKGKTTWEGFVPPCKFKDGDVVATKLGSVFILKNSLVANTYSCYVALNHESKFIHKEQRFGHKDLCRFATEEEKQKLFQAIKNNGYYWNAETKTLEKLVIKQKFKIGDCVVHHKYGKGDVTQIIWMDNEIVYEIHFENLTTYCKANELCKNELAPDKFDVTNFEPFMKVLVRSDNSDVWECDFFSLYNPKCSNRFHCIGAWYNICIPYIGNEHLRGTTNDCDEYYKNWE